MDVRYKVEATTHETFREAEKNARADTQVFVVLAGRRLLSVGELSEGARLKLTQLGATISIDGRYDPTTS